MKRKLVAVLFAMTLITGTLTGCGEKADAPKETAAKAEAVDKTELKTEASQTVIQNSTKPLSDFITAIEPEKGYRVKEVSMTYAGETSTIKTDEKFMDLKTGALTVTSAKGATTLMNENNVPNVSLTFKEVTKEAQELKLDVTLVNEKKEEIKDSNIVRVHVVPESMKVVEQLTKNQRISEKVKKYDFDVYAKNIAESVKDAAVTVNVKKSDVKFGTPGHYEVIYEVSVKPETGEQETGEIPVDVEIVGKEQEKEKDVITENVKPGEKPDEKKPNENKPSEEKKPEKKPETTGSGNSSGGNSSGGGNTSSGNGNSSGGGNTSSGGSTSSGGGSTSTHTHNWVAHTATRQVWVPDIVVVDDYELRDVKIGYDVVCNCGARFRNGAGHPEHSMAHGLAGEDDGYWEEDVYEKKNVKVGSHEEDHGYYKDEPYTDYTYCSECGVKQ